MASSSGTSSYGASRDDPQKLMDQRRKKRLISNRDSARRSRLRKQKQLNDLNAEAEKIRKENDEILTKMNFTTENYLNIEAENSILRAQMDELSYRLQSLNEILSYLNADNGGFGNESELIADSAYSNLLNQSWNSHLLNQQPIACFADFLQY